MTVSIGKFKKVLSILLVVLLSFVVFAEGEEGHVHGEDCESCIVQSYESTNVILELEKFYFNFGSDLLNSELEKFRMDILEQIKELENNVGEHIFLAIEYLSEEISAHFESINVTLDIHDADISKIYEVLGKMTEDLEFLTENVSNVSGLDKLIEELSIRLDMHDQDVVNLFDMLALKAESSYVEEIEERLSALEKNVSEISVETSRFGKDFIMRLEILEEYANLIYDLVNSAASVEDVESMIEPLKTQLDGVTKELNTVVRKTREQDVDIIKLYDAVARLADEVKRLSGRLSVFESMLNELRNK